MSYSIKDLKVLSPQEHVRQRKLMYIGDSQNPAPLFNEIFDNALDESQAGFSDKTDVIINYDLNQITITDYGRGFPQGKLKDTQRDKDVEALELLCTTAFSGGKFSNINYRISSGLHGVGLLVTNSLSSEFKIETWRKNSRVTYVGKQGETVSCKVSKTTKVTNSGTTVTFIPDKTMFSDIQIPLSHIKMRCHVAEAFGMKCSLTVIRSGVEEVIDTTSDIYDLLPEDEASISEYYRHTFTVKDEETGEFATIALKYTSDTKSYYRGYTNLLYNSNGGSHHKMLDSAIQEAWSKIKVDGIKPNDVFLGLRGVVAVFISDAEFSSQSKERLAVNKDKLETLRELIVKEIYKWLKKNDEVRESLIKRFQEYRASQNKLLARKEIKSLLVVNTSKEGSIKRGTNIRKLRECDSKKREGTELFIVEGDSAVGSAVKARDVHLQSILPVKGKVLNVARCSDIKEALTNEETRDIVNAIGAGIGDDSDSSKSRYDRIIFMADADADGKEICVLLSGMFVNLLPNLVKDGLIYVALPPLYGWESKSGKKGYCNLLNDVPKDYKVLTRYKGLGQMDPDELWESVMNPKTRRLLKLEYPDDIKSFNSILTSSAVKFKMLEDKGLIKYEV